MLKLLASFLKSPHSFLKSPHSFPKRLFRTFFIIVLIVTILWLDLRANTELLIHKTGMKGKTEDKILDLNNLIYSASNKLILEPTNFLNQSIFYR